MPDERSSPPRKGACALCGSPDGELCPCLGCETPYHERCVVGRGCSYPGCALEGMRGRSVLPRDAAFPVACVFYFLAALCFGGLLMQRDGGNIGTNTPVELAMFASLGLALVLTIVAYVRDGLRPPGRLFRREIAGRVLVLCAGLFFIGASFERGITFAGAAWVAFLSGVLAMTLQPHRKTHHPLRRSGLPELVVKLLIMWLLLAAGVSTMMFGSRSYRAERANTRACYANQKTLVGALEMYNLDTKAQRLFEASLFRPLTSGGYLQSVPQDPGQGPGSSGHYRGTRGGNGLTCTVHGSIQ